MFPLLDMESRLVDSTGVACRSNAHEFCGIPRQLVSAKPVGKFCSTPASSVGCLNKYFNSDKGVCESRKQHFLRINQRHG